MSIKTLFTAAAVLAGTIASASTADAQYRRGRVYASPGATYYNPGVYSSGYLPGGVYSRGYTTYPTINQGVVVSNGFATPYTTGYSGMTYGYPYSSGVYGSSYGYPYSSGVYGTSYYSGYNNIYTGQSGVGLGTQGISVGGLPIFRW